MSKPEIRIVETTGEQLRLWVSGESVHKNLPEMNTYECCPDFSCCKPELQAPVEVRQAFAVGSPAQRDEFLMMFLGAMLASHKPEAKVHLVGGEPGSES